MLIREMVRGPKMRTALRSNGKMGNIWNYCEGETIAHRKRDRSNGLSLIHI